MKPTKTEFNEMDHNIHGEEVAIRDYKKFYAHLVSKGRMSEARKINEIMNEEIVHRAELLQIKKQWRGMK
jgi:ferritin-like protein